MRRYTCDRVEDGWIDTAPVRFVHVVDVHAGAERIWAALEDAAAWPRWAWVITRVEWTSPPPFGVGTTRRVHMRGAMSADETFVAWEPHRRMAFRFDEASIDGVRAFAERYTLEPLAGACTRVEWVMAMAPAGASKAIVPVLRLPMRAAFGRMLRRFGALVEHEYVSLA